MNNLQYHQTAAKILVLLCHQLMRFHEHLRYKNKQAFH